MGKNENEKYKDIPYFAIPFKEIDAGNLSVLEAIDPQFKSNNLHLYQITTNINQVTKAISSTNSIKRTYDDSFTRNVTIDFFKRYFNVNLISHPRSCI